MEKYIFIMNILHKKYEFAPFIKRYGNFTFFPIFRTLLSLFGFLWSGLTLQRTSCDLAWVPTCFSNGKIYPYREHLVKNAPFITRIDFKYTPFACIANCQILGGGSRQLVFLHHEGGALIRKVLISNWPWSKFVPLDPSWTNMPTVTLDPLYSL